MLEFEWDVNKEHLNQTKHGVGFAEAVTIFDDPLARTVRDPRSFEGEVRFATIGYSNHERLVVVWYTDRGDRARIIGARLATSAERRSYESDD